MTGPFDRLCELLQEEAAALKVRGTWNAEQRDPQQAAADWLAAAAVEGFVLALSGSLSRWLEELDGGAEDILGPGDDPA